MNRISIKMIPLLMLATAFSCVSAYAEDVAARATIHFTGTSTLHDFEGEASTHPFTALFEKDTATGQLHVSAATSLEVQEMTTNNRKRDRNMFKMFDLTHFTRIQGSLEHALLSENRSTEATLHLKIRNVEHDVKATLSDVKRDNQRISCTMTFPVSLSHFNLKAPSVLGMIRVGDTVEVECTITGRVVEKIAETES